MSETHPAMSVNARVATDVGGTFTDLVYFGTDPTTGRQIIRMAKADTTPPDFERGIMDVFAKADIDPAQLTSFTHGTTSLAALTMRKRILSLASVVRCVAVSGI